MMVERAVYNSGREQEFCNQYDQKEKLAMREEFDVFVVTWNYSMKKITKA